MFTILVVDDEPFVRVSMASLQDWPALGYDFRFEAGNGRQALEMLAQHPEIDVVLLDLSMPVMDGIDFLKALPDLPTRRNGPPAVVVLSAHDNFHLVREAFTLGVRDYLLKTEADDVTLKAILDKVVAELGTRGGESSEAVGQRELMTNQLLRDLLLEEQTPEWTRLAQSLNLQLPVPVIVWSIRILDFESVEDRCRPDELIRFNQLFLRSVRQLLEKRARGWAIAVAKDHLALFTSQTIDVTLFTNEVRESLERYLSVRVEVNPSLPVEVSGVQNAWRDLGLTRSVTSRIVRMTKRYLREHRTSPIITLDELAAYAEVSRNHLSWEFTRETGETITDYLARLRVEDACLLLSTTNLKVYEISEKVGYTNVEHFSRVFKRITGSSPNQWARESGERVFRDIRQ